HGPPQPRASGRGSQNSDHGGPAARPAAEVTGAARPFRGASVVTLEHLAAGGRSEVVPGSHEVAYNKTKYGARDALMSSTPFFTAPRCPAHRRARTRNR